MFPERVVLGIASAALPVDELKRERLQGRAVVGACFDDDPRWRMHEARTATLFHGFQPFDLDIRGINGDVILRCLKAVRHHRAAYAHKRGRQTAASAGNVLKAELHPSSPVDERIPNRSAAARARAVIGLVLRHCFAPKVTASKRPCDPGSPAGDGARARARGSSPPALGCTGTAPPHGSQASGKAPGPWSSSAACQGASANSRVPAPPR